MKELRFFAAGIVLGVVLLWIIFEMSSYPGEKEHQLRQQVLDDSLATLNSKLDRLEADIAISDGIIDSNKDRIFSLLASLSSQTGLY